MPLLLSDKEQIQGLKAGDSSIYEDVFKAYYKDLCCYAYAFLGNSELSEEVVHECFCNIWIKRRTLTIQESLRFYLLQSVKNRCLNRLKAEIVRKKHLKIFQEELLNREQLFGEVSSDSTKYEDLKRELLKAVDKLPPRCLEIFELSKFQGMSYSEIAEKLQISSKTVENQISRAYRILRKNLPPEIYMFLLLIQFL